ncbi:hypothetical protein BJX70DRAFT_399738 [Aspergillus crustosus]
MAALKDGSASKFKRVSITHWISYNNKTTLKQKVDWVNSVGLGGAMIWASDQDTEKYDAHAALIQRNITSTARMISGWTKGLASAGTLRLEHPIDRQVLVAFFNTINTRILLAARRERGPGPANARPINPAGIPVGIQPDTVNDRLFEALGSGNYPYPVSLLEKQVNSAKGRLMGGRAPTSVDAVRKRSIKAVQSGDDEDINLMMHGVRVQHLMQTNSLSQGISIFDYFNQRDAGYIEEDVPGLPDLAALWVEFFNDFVQTRQRYAQNWLRDTVFAALKPWLQAYENNEVDLF